MNTHQRLRERERRTYAAWEVAHRRHSLFGANGKAADRYAASWVRARQALDRFEAENGSDVTIDLRT